MMRTSNPALTSSTFEGFAKSADQRMTLSGTVNKSFILVLLVLLGAVFSWREAAQAVFTPVWYWPAMIAGLIVGFIIIFRPRSAPILAPVYALCEGVLLGFISAIFEMRYPGIVFQAVLATMGTFIALLLAYKSRMIQATANFRLGVMAATGGIALVYLIDIILRMFSIQVPFIHETGPMGIVVSMVIVIIAALNLVLDFDFIEHGANSGAPRYMEWYSAFGLLVTLVWLYLEILRLLSKSRRK